MVKGQQQQKQPLNFLPGSRRLFRNSTQTTTALPPQVAETTATTTTGIRIKKTTPSIHTTLMHLQQQQQQQKQQLSLSHNAAHALYSGTNGVRRSTNHDDDDDDGDGDNEEYGYSLEIYGSDDGESVSTLNDSCFGGASVTGGYNLSNDKTNYTTTAMTSSPSSDVPQQQQQSPMKQATSLVVGVVPMNNTSFDTEDISYFVHDILPTTTTITNDQTERQPQKHIRSTTMKPILKGTVSPKEKYLSKFMNKYHHHHHHTASDINNSVHNNGTAATNTMKGTTAATLKDSRSFDQSVDVLAVTAMASSGRTATTTATPPSVAAAASPSLFVLSRDGDKILISETTSTESHRFDDDDDDNYDELHMVEMNLSQLEATFSSNNNSNQLQLLRRRRLSCCPLWYHNAPAHIKCLVWFGICILCLSIVVALTGIGLALFAHFAGNENNNETSSSNGTNSSSSSSNNLPNNLFVNAPTTTPVVIASDTPTISSAVSLSPSIAPFTIIPDPTTAPISATTDSPIQPTKSTTIAPLVTTPSGSPTVSPSTQPSPLNFGAVSPDNGEIVEQSSSFHIYITGGRYSDTIRNQILTSIPNIPLTIDDNIDDNNNNDPRTFMIHLGDWTTTTQANDGTDDSSTLLCTSESSYQSISALFSISSIPTYFLMGENESTTCTDPTTSVSLWKQYLLDYEIQFWSSKSWDVNERQSDSFDMYNENRMFSSNHVTFVTLNIVTEKESNVELKLRHEANLEWIDYVYTKSTSQPEKTIQTIVLFANDGPDGGSVHNTPFYTELLSRIKSIYIECHFIIVSRATITTDTVTASNTYQEQYKNVVNLSIVSILSPIWPPVRMTIDVAMPKNEKNATTISSVPHVSFQNDSW